MSTGESPETFEGLEADYSSRVDRRDRPPSNTKRYVYFALGGIALAIATVFVLEACGVEIWPRNPEVWERISYKSFPAQNGSTDVFYNRRVEKSQAAKLGEFLKGEGYFDVPHPVSVFLTRRDNALIVSFFVNGDALDEQVMDAYRKLVTQLRSDVFAEAPVEIDLCSPLVEGGLTPKLLVITTIR